jgi:hypothetical protein
MYTTWLDVIRKSILKLLLFLVYKSNSFVLNFILNGRLHIICLFEGQKARNANVTHLGHIFFNKLIIILLELPR